MRKVFRFTSICAAMCAAAAMGFSQSTPPAPAGDILGPGNFLHVVENADQAIPFYHDILGMDLQRPANAPAPVLPRPFLTTPEIQRLYDSVGIPYRTATAMITESPMRAELVEWQASDRKPIRPRFQDPGASNMILLVKDLDAIMVRVKQAHATVVTLGGEPVTIETPGGKIRMVLLQDTDGFFVELIQPTPLPASAAQSSNNVFSVGFGFTVGDMDRMIKLFKDALGFEPKAGPWMTDKTRASAAGVPGAQYRRATALVPGSALEVEFLEFKGVDRKTYATRPRDPGTPILRLRVRDMDSTVARLTVAGLKVASTGAQAVSFTNNNNTQRIAILQGPDNLKIQLVQPVQ